VSASTKTEEMEECFRIRVLVSCRNVCMDLVPLLIVIFASVAGETTEMLRTKCGNLRNKYTITLGQKG
jgi:hypothetical protein